MYQIVKLFLVIIVILSMVGCAGSRSRRAPIEKGLIAVYVTGEGVPENILSTLNTKILHNLIQSGKYRGVERTSTFIDIIKKEHTYQRTGAVADDQIRQVGQQLGLDYICVGSITRVVDAFLISVRILNVETAEVMAIGTTRSYLGNLAALDVAAENVVKSMHGEKPKRGERIAGTGTLIVGGLLTALGATSEDGGGLVVGGLLTMLVGGGMRIAYKEDGVAKDVARHVLPPVTLERCETYIEKTVNTGNGAGVNIRSGPSRSHGVIGDAPDKVTIQVCEGGGTESWDRVRYRHYEGFMDKKFILDEIKIMWVRPLAVGDELNVRASPSMSASVLTTIPPGDAVEVYVTGGNETWARVRYNGIDGYSARRFLTDVASGEG